MDGAVCDTCNSKSPVWDEIVRRRSAAAVVLTKGLKSCAASRPPLPSELVKKIVVDEVWSPLGFDTDLEINVKAFLRRHFTRKPGDFKGISPSLTDMEALASLKIAPWLDRDMYVPHWNQLITLSRMHLRLFRRTLSWFLSHITMRLTNLDLSKTQLIHDEGFKDVAKGVGRCWSLTCINLSNNHIMDSGALAMAKAVRANPSLQSMDLSHNPGIGPVGWEAVADAAGDNRSLRMLDLHGNKITETPSRALAKALWRNKSLNQLTFGMEKLVLMESNMTATDYSHCFSDMSQLSGDAGAIIIAAFLPRCQCLAELNLSWNFIGDEGAEALAEAIRAMAALSGLNLSRNQIGHRGAEALGAAVAASTSLTELSLRCNCIGDYGAQAIGAALLVTKSLNTLALSGNGIGDDGAKALGAAVAVNSSVKRLDLCNNNIGDPGAGELGSALGSNTTLSELGLFNNQVGDPGAMALAEGVKVNASLKHLGLENNLIGEPGAVALAEGVRVMNSLNSLNLLSNTLKDVNTAFVLHCAGWGHTHIQI